MRGLRLSHNVTKLHSKQKQSCGFCSETDEAYQLENWSVLVRNHISGGSPEKAIRLYIRIRSDGFHASGLVPLVLKACASLFLTSHAMALHAESLKLGIDAHVLVGTSIVSAYAKCLALRDARKMFDQMPHRNPITWNAMIGGYFKNRDSDSASALFDKMPERTSVTWIEMIGGLSRIGNTVKARKFFDLVPRELKNLVTWTVMVDGYCANEEMESAREVFNQMPERNSFAWSSMVSGYCKTGNVKEGRAMFDRIPAKNLVNWNSMISGYVQNGFPEEALSIFHEMRGRGFEPDQVTAATVLSACAQSGSQELGEEIHRRMIEKRVKPNRIVLNALVDMYAKCGDLGKARLVFEGIGEGERSTGCWNAMISGLAANGRCEEALELFRRVASPDEVTFLAALSACAHGGLVDKGVEIFSETMTKHGVGATVKHYGCLVDLLGRSGRLREAFDLIKRMPMEPNDTVWGAMLGACCIHSDAEMTERVVAELETPDPKPGSASKKSHYALLSNIYAASEKWEKAMRIRIYMANRGLEKTPGFSSVVP